MELGGDSFNRLTGATVNGAEASYGYNHLSQRVTKTLNGHTRLLVYDQAGNLISELDGTTGAVLAEYIWLDGTPLAYIEQDQLYHVDADHLGTPRALTDFTGTVVWKADYSPFGLADITSQGLTFNLRFPGQYYDAESGLHYNWHRYYDPGTGRYITSDPIGLAGGINTYSYVDGNPLIYFDPYGLVRWGAAGSATLGLVGNGFGVFVGAGLFVAPEPSSTLLGAAVFSKSISGFGLNAYNLVRAFSDDDSYDAPSSAPRIIARSIAPCSVNADRYADAVELALDFASGRAVFGYLPQGGSAFNRRATFAEINKFHHQKWGQPTINKASDALQSSQSAMYGIDAAESIKDNYTR